MSVTCTICNKEIKSNFCDNCGQSYTAKQLSLRSMFSDLASNSFSINRGALPTFYYIITNPKKIVNNYWDGFKNYYASPGKVMIITLTFLGLYLIFTDNSVLGLHINSNNISPQSVLSLFFIPLFTFTSAITFYKKKKNLASHLVLSIYTFFSWLLLISILEAILINFLKFDFQVLLIIVFILGSFYSFSASFSETTKEIMLKIIVQLLVFFSILLLLGGFIYILAPSIIEIQ